MPRWRWRWCGRAPPDRSIAFEMVRSAASVNAGCVPDARADVSVTSKGSVEVMNVKAEGLPPKTEFDSLSSRCRMPPSDCPDTRAT